MIHRLRYAPTLDWHPPPARRQQYKFGQCGQDFIKKTILEVGGRARQWQQQADGLAGRAPCSCWHGVTRHQSPTPRPADPGGILPDHVRRLRLLPLPPQRDARRGALRVCVGPEPVRGGQQDRGPLPAGADDDVPRAQRRRDAGPLRQAGCARSGRGPALLVCARASGAGRCARERESGSRAGTGAFSVSRGARSALRMVPGRGNTPLAPCFSPLNNGATTHSARKNTHARAEQTGDATTKTQAGRSASCPTAGSGTSWAPSWTCTSCPPSTRPAPSGRRPSSRPARGPRRLRGRGCWRCRGSTPGRGRYRCAARGAQPRSGRGGTCTPARWDFLQGRREPFQFKKALPGGPRLLSFCVGSPLRPLITAVVRCAGLTDPSHSFQPQGFVNELDWYLLTRPDEFSK